MSSGVSRYNLGSRENKFCKVSIMQNNSVLALCQGILLEHREKEFGDKVNIEDVLQAAKRIAQELLPLTKN